MVPVDFSISSVAMSPYVRRAAKPFGATVSLVHVVDPATFDVFEAYELYEEPMSEVSEDRKVVARQKPDSFLKEEFQLVECLRILDSGDPGTRIGEIARDEEFDLIIIPTHACWSIPADVAGFDCGEGPRRCTLPSVDEQTRGNDRAEAFRTSRVAFQ